MQQPTLTADEARYIRALAETRKVTPLVDEDGEEYYWFASTEECVRETCRRAGWTEEEIDWYLDQYAVPLEDLL